MRNKIHDWKPWEVSTGPTTSEGKKASSSNSTKHGWYSKESQLYLRVLKQSWIDTSKHRMSENSEVELNRMLEKIGKF